MDDRVIKRLNQLYAVAMLRVSEEGDEGRANEARNAAFLLLKTARDNGIEIRFVEAGSVSAAAPRGAPMSGSAFESVMSDLFGSMARDLRQQKPPEQVIKVISARYAGYCRVCKKGYKAKERVVWMPGGSGCTHVNCAR